MMITSGDGYGTLVLFLKTSKNIVHAFRPFNSHSLKKFESEITSNFQS